MRIKNNQKGVGLMEVIVALFILAIAVLGFSILQMRAFEATQEATNRSIAMNLARDLAERMRVNKNAQEDYKKAINLETTNDGCMGSVVDYVPVCTSSRMAEFDAKEILDKAKNVGQTIVIGECIGSNTLSCIYISWGKTEITATNLDQCVNENTGTYITNSKCLIMEAF